jgi:hypothetical protein
MMTGEFKSLKKVGVKRFTPTAQVLCKNLPTGCSERIDLRKTSDGDSCLALLSIDFRLSRPKSLWIQVYPRIDRFLHPLTWKWHHISNLCHKFSFCVVIFNIDWSVSIEIIGFFQGI